MVRKLKSFWFIIILPVLILPGCQSPPDRNIEESASPERSYATQFHIEPGKITVEEAWPGASPQTYDIPDSVERIICTSTTHLHFLELLGVENRIVGFPDTRFIYSEKIKALVDADSIKDVGSGGNMNVELIISLEPDLVIAFDAGTGSSGLDELQKVDIPVMLNADYMETSALGRAEWIKFFGALTGQQDKADSIFSSIRRSYEKTKLITSKITRKPTILSGVVYGDTWFMPGNENWFVGFFEDAGGQFLWDNHTGSGWQELAFEAVFAKGKNADFWIGTGGFYTRKSLVEADERYEYFRAFEEWKIYNYAKRINDNEGNDFFESAYARPDIVLKDLIKILHPHLLPHHDLYYFKRLP